MVPPFRYRLSEREKDALLAEQAARIAELEALLARPKKTSQNSHMPPSQDRKPSGSERKEGKRHKPRPSRPGVARCLTDAPEATVRRFAEACPRCAAWLSLARQIHTQLLCKTDHRLTRCTPRLPTDLSAGDQQRLRARNPPVGDIPQGHRRLPVQLGRPHPRRLPLHHRYRPAPRPHRPPGRRPPPHRNLHADTSNLKKSRGVSSYQPRALSLS